MRSDIMNYHTKDIAFFNALTLQVTNLNKSKQYYEDIIGLTALNVGEDFVDFTTNGKDVLLRIEQPQNIKAKNKYATGIYHFALLLPSRADLANFTNSLISKAVEIGAANHLVSEALYLKDPDGVDIEIYADTDPNSWTWEEAMVTMTSDPLDFNDLIKQVNNSAAVKLPEGTIMGHIHMYAKSLEPMLTFYRDALNFEIVSQFGAQAAFMSKEKYHHHIAVNTWKGSGAPLPQKDEAGLKSLELRFENEEKRQAQIKRLEDYNFEVIKEDQHYTVNDPEGNKIELTLGV